MYKKLPVRKEVIRHHESENKFISETVGDKRDDVGCDLPNRVYKNEIIPGFRYQTTAAATLSKVTDFTHYGTEEGIKRIHTRSIQSIMQNIFDVRVSHRALACWVRLGRFYHPSS